MFIVCIRTFIIYMVVLLALRIMGKSELSKTSTFQMVILFMIAELAALPIDSPSSSLINGVAAIFTLLFLQVLLSYISIKSEKMKNFINGKPSVIIDQGRLNVMEMKRLRITVNELFEQLRIQDCPAISDVAYAVMESNGELSVIEQSPSDALPLILINDGVIYRNNLSKAGMDESQLFSILKSKGIDSLQQVFVAFYDTDQQLHVFPFPDRNETFSQEVI